MGKLEAGRQGVPGRGKAGGWGGSRQGIQNQFVEAQQIDFGGSGPWEGWRLGRQGVPGRGKAGGWESPRRESKINLLRLNKLILVVPGRGKAGGWESPCRESKINLLRLNKLILVVRAVGRLEAGK